MARFKGFGLGVINRLAWRFAVQFVGFLQQAVTQDAEWRAGCAGARQPRDIQPPNTQRRPPGPFVGQLLSRAIMGCKQIGAP